MLKDPEVMQYTSFERALTSEEVPVKLKEWIDLGAGELGVWAVTNENDLIGWAMLNNTHFEAPEMGYMFNKESWGQGYASELVELLISHAKMLGLEYVMARVHPDNHASIKVLEKSGLKPLEKQENLNTLVFYSDKLV